MLSRLWHNKTTDVNDRDHVITKDNEEVNITDCQGSEFASATQDYYFCCCCCYYYYYYYYY